MAVVAHVVNGEDDRESLRDGVGGVTGAQQNRNERGLPVVTVDEVGLPEMFCDFDGAAAELAVALGVVRIVAAAFAVDAGAVEVLRIIDEEILNAGEFA